MLAAHSKQEINTHNRKSTTIISTVVKKIKKTKPIEQWAKDMNGHFTK